MRTDVKIGLICAFAVILAAVIFFVAKGNYQPTAARGGTTNNTAGFVSTPASPAATPAHPDPALKILPPGSPRETASAAPASPSPAPIIEGHALASAAPIGSPGPYGGGQIIAPTPGPGTPTTPMPAPGSGTGTLAPTPAPTPAPSPSIDPAPSMTIDHSPSYNPNPLPTTPPLITRSTPAVPSPVIPVTPGATTYKIAKGDMLGTVAKKFNVTVKALEEANPGVDSNHLKIDQTIKIPAPTASVSPTPHPATRPAATRPTSHPAATHPAPGATAGSGAPKPGTTYIVKAHDSLSSIALAAYGTKSAYQKIFRANRGEISDPNVVPVGTSLKLPE